MTHPLGVGLVGTGDISGVYLRTLARSRQVRVVACASRDRGRAEARAQEFGIPRVHSSVDALLADPAVDIVLNLTPPASHAEVTLNALAAGKHVYSEKTLATTMSDARAILDAAHSAGLAVACAPDTVLGARLQALRRIIDDDVVGSVVGGIATAVLPGLEWFHANPTFYYARGAGPLADLGPYYVAALVSLLGPVRRCSGMSRRSDTTRVARSGPHRGETIEVEVETHVSGLLELGSGAVVTLVMSVDVWDSQLPRIELWGAKGTACLPDLDPLDGPNLFGGPLWLKTSETARFRDMPRPGTHPEWEDVPIGSRFAETSHADNSRGLGLVEMADALRDGRQPRLSGDLALHVLEVITAVTTAAAEGRVVDVVSTCGRPDPLPATFAL